MTAGGGPNATGPPRIGRAIIGATLLLKGDAVALLDVAGDANTPEATRDDRVRVVLPDTRFGGPDAGAPAVHGEREKAKPAPAATTSLRRSKDAEPVGRSRAESFAAMLEPKASRKPKPVRVSASRPARPLDLPPPSEPPAAPVVIESAPEPVSDDAPFLPPPEPSTVMADHAAPVAPLAAEPPPQPAPAVGPAEVAESPMAEMLPETGFGAVVTGKPEPQAASPADQPHSADVPVPVAGVEAIDDTGSITPSPWTELPSPAFGGAAAPSAGRPEEAGQPPSAPAPPEQAAPVLAEPQLPMFPGNDTASAAAPAKPPRLALAEGAERADALPRPDFGPAASGPAKADPGAELAASRAAIAPLGGISGTIRAPIVASQGAAKYVDTSPRMPGDPAPVFTADDELILQLQTAGGQLADTITAYGTRSGVYLPVGEIARFLDLAIPVSDDGHYASGWFLDEKRTLSINLRAGTLVVEGKQVPLLRGDAAAFEGELYLRAEKFPELLPLTLTVDLRDQTVTVKTKVPFPFEERMRREAAREQLGAGSREAVHWPREPTPYRALSFPLADVELRGVSDQTYGTRAEGDLRIAGDFAFMTARAFVSGTTRDGLTGARLMLGRRDPDSGLLGPLGASEFQLGDVTTQAMPLGLRGVSGRGAFVTNYPLERASLFDTIDLHGELPDGYEVELYRNNVLIGSTRTPVNGEYQFPKVTLDYGLNVFRFVFYGPQGQRREDVRRISVGDGRLSPGELVYTFGAAQKDVSLFDVHGPAFSPGLDYGAWRGSALAEYGLSRQITASLGAAWYESRFGRHWLGTAGLRTGFGGTALKLDFGYQSGGATAVQAGVGGRVLGASYTLTHAEYSGGFTDEVRSFTADPLRRATELNVNATLHFGSEDRPLMLPLYGQYRRIEFADGRKQTDATLRSSLPVAGLLLSNTLNYTANSMPGLESSTQLRGTFDLAMLSGSRLQLRAGAIYSLVPGPRLEGATGEASYALDERTLVRGSVTHSLSDDRTEFGLSAVRRFGKFTLAFDGSYGTPDRSYSAALRLGFGFGRNPLTGRLFFAEPGLASGGAVAVRAFRDNNGNRLFDRGEPVLPEVDFLAGSSRARTDSHGIAMLGQLGDGNRTNLLGAKESLPDIALAPVSEGIELVPRAGRVHVTNYAVQMLGDISGTAYFVDGDALGREVSGLRLVLTDLAGKPIARARTEGDGTYYFEQVPAGRYTVEIDKNQAASLRIHLAEPIALTVEPTGDYLKQVVKVSRD